MHADWGLTPKKRQMVRAKRTTQGIWALEYPIQLVTSAQCQTLFATALDWSAGAQILAGFDLPFGVPKAWAKGAGVKSWRALLELLKGPEEGWEGFWEVCESKHEISWKRPFYPKRPGGTKLQHLLDGLQFEDSNQLRRVCDVAKAGQRAPAPLFWTMGANQVGKAALHAWKHVLLPGLENPKLKLALWPFDGQLQELEQQQTDVIVCETYPTLMSEWMGLSWTGSKRAQEARVDVGEQLLEGAKEHDWEWSKELEAALRDGFGAGADGEDQLDALIGALGMIDVVEGRRQLDEGVGRETREVEGWILGKDA